MKTMRYSVALSEGVHTDAVRTLVRDDGQEDLGFAVWVPSRGAERETALITEFLSPLPGERHLHGNASFEPCFFERALGAAMASGGGLAFLHSHPFSGWQGMSPDDVRAERGMAGAVLAATGLPLVGLTIAAHDRAWSGRFWMRAGPGNFERRWCENVRVVGARLGCTFCDEVRPPPLFGEELDRTISAWGPEVQATLSRLRVGIVGLGSVGSIVAEILARSGIQDIELFDFDRIERVNLDRVLHAYREDAAGARLKTDVSATALRRSATAPRFSVRQHVASICEEAGYRAALDCDVLFSCVDRPWARSVLNFIAYAHLIPVIDGGIHVSRTRRGKLRGAEWKAHVAGPSYACLECLGQYAPGLIAAEREGLLDDPAYIEGIGREKLQLGSQNVFAFSTAVASMEVLQLVMLVASPAGVGSPGAQTYHMTNGLVDLANRTCATGCPYPALVGRGEEAGHPGTGKHGRATEMRSAG